MQRAMETLGGLWALFVLGLRSGFRLRSSPYWRWRMETAFGTDRARWPTRRERVAAMLEYGRWVYRMKRRR